MTSGNTNKKPPIKPLKYSIHKADNLLTEFLHNTMIYLDNFSKNARI
ncbi:hypothetical protein O59_001412 [Cellvibrio sp. BR]|nr:hypothetical protein O59_001412 [Cellvibrio sp. BR]